MCQNKCKIVRANAIRSELARSWGTEYPEKTFEDWILLPNAVQYQGNHMISPNFGAQSFAGSQIAFLTQSKCKSVVVGVFSCEPGSGFCDRVGGATLSFSFAAPAAGRF